MAIYPDADWLAGQDLGPSYLGYRDVLQTLDRHDGRRWVIKAPNHLAELGPLVDAFPGAVVVQLHRDIVATIASGASLFVTQRRRTLSTVFVRGSSSSRGRRRRWRRFSRRRARRGCGSPRAGAGRS